VGPPLTNVPTLDDDEFSKLRLVDTSIYTDPDRSPVSTVTVAETVVSELSSEESVARGRSPIVVNDSERDVVLPSWLVEVTRV
jgi:hypothetical protein